MQFLTFTSLLLSASVALAAPVEERQACPTGISQASASRVAASFTKSGVVPTLIPTISPKIEVNVKYPARAVDLGNQFTTPETLAPPTYFLSKEADQPASTTYSLFMIDPDVPGPMGPPILGTPRLNYLHWYISGVKPCVANSGNTISFYQSPTPLSPGEQHRYSFVAYREPAGYKPNAISAQVKPAFDLLGYTTAGNLGTPIGGNFFNQSITNGILPS